MDQENQDLRQVSSNCFNLFYTCNGRCSQFYGVHEIIVLYDKLIPIKKAKKSFGCINNDDNVNKC